MADVESAGVCRRDLETLAWVGEQYGVRVDQLEVLLGFGRSSVSRLVGRLRGAGLVEARRLLADERTWVVPTARGLRACGSSFGPWRPTLGLLAHVAAVTEVRLHVQARSPESEWVCERVLAREKRSAREHLADAVIVLDGRRIAVEVELTVKSKRRTVAIVEELTSRYDAVLYFCAPGPRRLMSELAAGGEWPSLGIRELPERCRSDPR